MLNERFHQMDFCRAVFMYCGLLFHCGLIYGSGHSWRVESDETIRLFFYLSNFLHHFRMEAFYVVGGFFYLLIYQKHRPNFLLEKLIRAAVPMIVVGVTLNIAMNHLSVNQNYALNLDYLMTGKWLSHLWFLGNLIVYFVLALPICAYMHQMERFNGRAYFVGVLCMLLALAVSGQLMANYLELKSWLFINLNYLVYFFSYFLMGVVAFQYRTLFISMLHIKRLPLFFSCYVILQLATKLYSDMNDTLLEVIKLASHFPLMLAAFSLLCFLGRGESKWVRKFSDASYTIYLLHQPLLIFFYLGIFQWVQLGAVSEYLMLVFLVFGVSFYSHLYLVDNSVSLKFALNGVVPSQALARFSDGFKQNLTKLYLQLLEYLPHIKRNT